MTSFMDEIKKIFKSLENTVKELSQQVDSIRNSIDFLSKQYDLVSEKISVLEGQRKDNLAAIQNLEDKLENTEKYQRSSSVEIRNIPAMKPETKGDLSELVLRISQLVNIPLRPTDIKDIFRINSKSSNKSIIVDFSTVIYKEKFLHAIKTYNNANKNNKLNTSNLKFDLPAKPIFISENLTSKMRKIFYLAREYAKCNNYKYCWTSHGKVYLRRNDGAAHVRIVSEQDLSKLSESK